MAQLAKVKASRDEMINLSFIVARHSYRLAATSSRFFPFHSTPRLDSVSPCARSTILRIILDEMSCLPRRLFHVLLRRGMALLNGSRGRALKPRIFG